MNFEEWKSQLKRGVLEYSVLLLINNRDYYGYGLINELGKWSILAVKENTIYPLLRRLLKEGILTSYWKETEEGVPKRKYYKITELGTEYLKYMQEEWENLKNSISEVGGL